MEGRDVGQGMGGSGSGVGKDRRDGLMAMKMNGTLQLPGVRRGRGGRIFRTRQRPGIRKAPKGWRDGSVVKSTDCSSRGPEFKSQQPHGGSQPSVMGVLII